MPTEEFVRAQFAPWETPDPISWFATALADNIKWTILGKTNPLAGVYNSRDEVLSVFGTLMSKMAGPPNGKIESIIASGDYAVVEMSFSAPTKSPLPEYESAGFEEDMCWVCKYEGDTIVELRCYIDTLGEKILFEME
jgi:ketosteroid isomerase-like protein